MSTHIQISPPAFGKTSACIQAIQALFARKPDAQVWVIVRDRLQAAHFRSRLAAQGGAINVRIETFRDLYLEILEQSGLPMRPQAGPALQYRLVQAAVEQAELGYFLPLRGLPGLTASMQALIAELQRGLVSASDVLAQADPARPGHVELARIYQAYLELLERIGWQSPEGLALEALHALESCPALLADWDLLVVDGFDWFDTDQRRVLQALANRVRHTRITLPGDPQWMRTVHHRFKQSYEELSVLVDMHFLPALDAAHLPGPLAALEAGLFETSAAAYAGDASHICLLEARSPAEEAREALRWLKARIVRAGLSPLACAVLVPDPDLYFPFLRQAASEFGLPLRFTQGRRLVDVPIIQVLLNLLSLPRSNFPRRALLDVLHSPLLDFSDLGLDRRQVNVLDLVSRQGKVIEGLAQWQEVFAGLEAQAAELQAAEMPGEQTDEEERARMPVLPRGSAAAALREALQRAWQVLCPPQAALTLPEWVAWLENCLAALHFYDAGLSSKPPARHSLAARHYFAVCRRHYRTASYYHHQYPGNQRGPDRPA